MNFPVEFPVPAVTVVARAALNDLRFVLTP